MSTPEKTDARAEVVARLKFGNTDQETINTAIRLLESDGARPAADLAKVREAVEQQMEHWSNDLPVDLIAAIGKRFACLDHAPAAVNKKIEEKARTLDWRH